MPLGQSPHAVATRKRHLRANLETVAFDLATLEYNLTHDDYIPSSFSQKQIEDATLGFSQVSTSRPPPITDFATAHIEIRAHANSPCQTPSWRRTYH